MKECALQLHKSMLQELQECAKKQFDEEKEIECCYQVCNIYWRRLSELLSPYQFNTEEDEIDFFKKIKPLFTSEIEYYGLLYHAQLFKPLFDKDALQKFWDRELTRLERFADANPVFLKYYNEGLMNYDQLLYLRKYNDDPESTGYLVTQLEKNTSARNDQLLAEYLALEKYALYVKTQLENLNTNNEN